MLKPIKQIKNRWVVNTSMSMFDIHFSPEPLDTTVYTWVDPEVKAANKGRTFKQSARQAYIKNKPQDDDTPTANMYLSSAMDRDERIYKLKQELNKADTKIKTVQDAMKLLDIKTLSVIIKYLKEIDMQLLNTETGKMVGAVTQSGELDPEQRMKLRKRSGQNSIAYYDKSPELGGKMITKSEYERLKLSE